MRQTLLGFEAGSCLLRDHHGRVEAIQVDLVVPALRRAFSTTPARVDAVVGAHGAVAAGAAARRGLARAASARASSVRMPAAERRCRSRRGDPAGARRAARARPTGAQRRPSTVRTGTWLGRRRFAAAPKKPTSAPAAGGTDPLVEQRAREPPVPGPGPEGELSSAARRNCATSGFVASAAPTGDYGLDVHIDTGVLGLSHGGLMSALQDLLVTPLWMALVWVVHALCVMLEWCFTLNLLDSPASGQLGSGLRQMQQALTDPWIPLVLAVACVLVALRRPHPPSRRGDARPGAGDGRDDGRRAVGDRGSQRDASARSGRGPTRRASERSPLPPGERPRTRRGARPEHAGRLLGGGRSAVVLPGVRRTSAGAANRRAPNLACGRPA